MAAVLRVYGVAFDPDGFLEGSGLRPCKVWKKGEPFLPASQPDGRRNEESGMNVVASEADFAEFPKQVEEATAFLIAHREELSRLHQVPGVEAMTLDFGIARRDVVVQYDYLPPSLIRISGELGIGIELSQYPVGEEDEADA